MRVGFYNLLIRNPGHRTGPRTRFGFVGTRFCGGRLAMMSTADPMGTTVGMYNTGWTVFGMAQLIGSAEPAGGWAIVDSLAGALLCTLTGYSLENAFRKNSISGI